MQKTNDISKRQAEVMELNFQPATALTDLESVSQLAGEIWRGHYKSIISSAQIEYMLSRFQSVDAIASQIKIGYQYYLLARNEHAVAYFAILPDWEQKSLHLSKLYVCKNWQRQGLGRHIVNFVEHYCRQHDLKSIWLNVNRHNQQAIDFYLRNRFTNTGDLIQDIGAGFKMDDFKMLKLLS